MELGVFPQNFKPSSFDLQVIKVKRREKKETLKLFQKLLWGRATSRIQIVHSFLF